MFIFCCFVCFVGYTIINLIVIDSKKFILVLSFQESGAQVCRVENDIGEANCYCNYGGGTRRV